MWTSFHSFLDTITSAAMLGFGVIEGSNVIYRDELIKKPSTKKVKKGDCKREPKEDYKKRPLMEKRSQFGSDDQEKISGMRVKVKMTKQEAARLLSKCKDGGVLEFRDLAHELVQIPVDRVRVVSSSYVQPCSGALESIPEEI